MEINEGVQRVRQMSIDVQVKTLQIEGLMKAYEAACLANAQSLIETYRTQIHEATDQLLDLKAAITEVSRRVAMG